MTESEQQALPPGPGSSSQDDFILQQAMLAGALELLPDKLAAVTIIPLQLRMVYLIGQRHGQELGPEQIKDLAGTLGIGVTAHVLGGAAGQVIGGLVKGIFGKLLGGATGAAASVALSFASTYALGHVAEQYYAQGRQLGAADLRALFSRFQEEARTLFPKVQEQIQAQARTLNLEGLISGLR